LEDILQNETCQDHGQRKGDDLLAAVRIVGRCATALVIVYYLWNLRAPFVVKELLLVDMIN
jgi:hypothetical protein